MAIHHTHPFLFKLNNLLNSLGYDLAPAHKPEYIAERLRENPGYQAGEYDRLSSHQFTTVNLDDINTHVCDDLVGVENQLYAWWDAKGYGILELTITQFFAPVNRYSEDRKLLTRTILKLVEGEDALDNDAFNWYGRHWTLLHLESSANDAHDQALMFLATFLASFDSSNYIEIED